MQMMIRLIVSLLLILSTAGIQSVQAANAAKDIPDAQTLIDACWAISEEDRSSSNTPRLRRGNLDTVLCLEKVILDQVDILFPDGKYLSHEKAREHLDQIRISMSNLYWPIYNEHIGCGISCGTVFHMMDLPPISKALEDMIRVMIKQRKRYEL